MKVPSFRDFIGNSVDQVVQFLSADLSANFKELTVALKKLAFEDNFESFEWTGEIAANAEIAIENKLRGGIIPSKRLIVRADLNTLVDGSTAWTKEHVYLKNLSGSTAVKATVIFLK